MVAQRERIRVLVVDDLVMVRRSLATCLAIFGDLELAGEAASGADALAACHRLQPDVVLMDLMMPEMDGVAATTAIKAQFPHIQVVALTSIAEPETLRRVLQAGAKSYLFKNGSVHELHTAIQDARAC